MKVLVTGATGYIGGRLVPRLLELGHTVRVLVRDAARTHGRPWTDRVEIATGDLLQPRTLTHALADVDAAYYLVHSMGRGGDYPAIDQRAAENFVEHAGHLKHVIYLGGSLPHENKIARHLASRAQVGQILRDGLPTTEFRAGPIIGSGSASFEMVRYLTERLPVMITPSWVHNPVQPIAVRDVLAYLLLALQHPPRGIINIGSEALTFKQMMLVYARVRGLHRLILQAPPILPPKFGALFVGLITPIPNTLAVPLIEGTVAPLVNDTSQAKTLFSEITPISYQRSVELAVQRILENAVETRWSGAMGVARAYELTDREGLMKEVRSIHVPTSTARVFQTFTGLGGDRGWLVWNRAWWIRGLLDRLVGGPGLRRGRRDPDELLPGEALDFWRVEAVQCPNLLRLRAEMKVPGHAWLQWEAVEEKEGTRLVQTALFAPRGLFGTLYWYLLYPLHTLIFTHMVQAIARHAVK